MVNCGGHQGGTFHEPRVLTSPRKADIIPFGLPDAAAASALSGGFGPRYTAPASWQAIVTAAWQPAEN